MNERRRLLLEEIAETLRCLLRGDCPPEIESGEPEDDVTAGAAESMNRLIRAFAEARAFLLALSEGRLEVDVPPRNFLISPFKQLHANLRHLTWQTHQITKGDLNQKVDFLGEFSVSFNEMIASLREKKAVEEALKRSEKKLRDITSALGEGVFLLNTEGELIFMNPAAGRMLGWGEEGLLGRRVHQIIHCRRADGSPLLERDCLVMHTIKFGETWSAHDDVFMRKDGSLLPVSIVSAPVLEEGKVKGCVVAFHDITVLKRAQETLERANEVLERQATTDALTGIPNRLKFNSVIGKETSKARRHGSPLTLIMFDIDHFKRINDTHGHRVGDMALQELAGLIASGIRKEDLLARWGGEEFVVLLPSTDRDGGIALAERFRLRVEQNVFSVIKTMTCSFGVAHFRQEDDEAAFIQRADQALYTAKRNGRNRVEASAV